MTGNLRFNRVFDKYLKGMTVCCVRRKPEPLDTMGVTKIRSLNPGSTYSFVKIHPSSLTWFYSLTREGRDQE